MTEHIGEGAPSSTTNNHHNNAISAMAPSRGPAPSMTVRARRRREEAVRRLVADVQSRPPSLAALAPDGSGSTTDPQAGLAAETHDWLVASTVAAALERGLDRDLHTELVQETKDQAGRIGQVCQDHADVFLASVAQVAALGEPSARLSTGLAEAHQQLVLHTAGPMLESAQQWEQAKRSYARARTLQVLVEACQKVAVHLERARKQAALGRPRAALEAVDRARSALTTPMESLFDKTDYNIWKDATSLSSSSTTLHHNTALLVTASVHGLLLSAPSSATTQEEKRDDLGQGVGPPAAGPAATAAATKKLVNLEQTPFGKRAMVILPKIESEVLQSAKRGLNRWFLALRTGGDGAKAGRSVLRQVGRAMAQGPGQLGLGGHLPPSYIWRAKSADNLLARVDQGGRIARAARLGYWFERDAPKEAERVEAMASTEGVERRAEALASAFGWYRCWPDNSTLLVDPIEFADMEGAQPRSGSSGGLSGSRHGLGGSRHGAGGGLRGSRHGSKNRSLGFRATTSSRSQAYQEITSTLGTPNIKTTLTSKWNDLLSPAVLTTEPGGATASATCKEEDDILSALPESVHPVRRAELAFALLGKTDEFVQYYETNRFGEIKIGGEKEGERKSVLSSLTGDDVTVGSDRDFFAKTLPHLCASVVGFSAVEAALEMSNFVDDDDAVVKDGKAKVGAVSSPKSAMSSSLSASRFRESSERYERALISELGNLVRGRSIRANLAEVVRMSGLLAAYRAALKIVHPSSSTRRFDKDLLGLDADILVTAVKLAQEEQLLATSAIVYDDNKVPMLVADSLMRGASSKKNNATGVPDPEEIGLPFGLNQMKQVPQKADLDFQEQARTSYNRAALDEAFTFSQSVPVVLRSIHARAIACAALALSQQELGQTFPTKKGSAAAGYVLDCLEECINVSAVGMKDSDQVVDEGSVDKAVQVMANIAALQHCLSRLFGTVMRGMCHIGLIQADEIEETFAYAEKALKGADKACDAQVGSMYSLIYEICRNKIDSHLNYALENFQWVAKSVREMPNAYCEGLIGYLKSVFASLGPMDEGSRAGLHFSCCGHVSERLVKILAGKPGDTTTYDNSGMPPISRIDAFGIKNLAIDCEEFERFADSTGVPQLRDCFGELRVLTSVMLDKELPVLLLPDNAAARRRKYPILSLEKVANILEKYVGTGLGDKLMGGGGRSADMLFIDKKEVQQLIKIVRSQVH